MKNLLKIFFICIGLLNSINLIYPANLYSQGTYFNDADYVYLKDGNPDDFESLESGDQRTIYWDLSSIDTNANRLDICIGYNEIHPGFTNDILWGNWLRNQYDDNFNVENSNLRFIYDNPLSISDSITGVCFINLNENQRKYFIVLRASGNMEIRENKNSFIQINDPYRISSVYGKVPVVGKFTTDTLEDLAIISQTDIRIFEATGDDDPPLQDVFTLQSNNFKKIILAQINHKYGVYSMFDDPDDRDDIVAQYGNFIYVFYNNNDNTTSSSPDRLIGFSDALSEFKIADFNNDGYNDIIAITTYESGFYTYGSISIFLNDEGIINTAPTYFKTGILYTNSVEVADFNKDGWNDFVIDKHADTIALFLNNKTSGLFSNSPSEGFNYADDPGPLPLYIGPIYARKIIAADLYNKGGIGVILAGGRL